MAAPLHVGASLLLSRGNGIASNGANNGRIGDFGLCSNHTVRDVVIDGLGQRSQITGLLVDVTDATHAVFLLLDVQDGAVLEGPAGHIGLAADALDEVRRLQGGPEVGKVMELDVVPDVGERGANDGALNDGGGRGDRGCGGHVAGSDSHVSAVGSARMIR